MNIVPNTRTDDTLSIETFLIIEFRSLGGVFELAVLKYTHFVLYAFSESLLATNQLSILQSSSFLLSKSIYAVLPLIKILVSSANDKLVSCFKQLGKSLT